MTTSRGAAQKTVPTKPDCQPTYLHAPAVFQAEKSR